MQIYKNTISIVLFITMLNFTACYSLETISLPEYQKIERENGNPKKIYVVTKDSENYHFDDWEYNIENDTLFGKGKILVNDIEQLFNGNIPLSEIQSFQLEELNSIATVSLIAGIVVAFALTIAIGASMENWRNNSKSNYSLKYILCII